MNAPPFPGQPGPDASQDPMMAMLQQMLGNAGSSGHTPGQPGDLPPGLADLFTTMQGGDAEPSPTQSSAWVWRLVHSLCALCLSFYIVLQTPFDGDRRSRTDAATLEHDWTLDVNPAETFKHFFYLFATFEVVLQSSRYFIEKGQLQGSGMLSSIAQFLPPPYSGYVRVVGRYSVIYSTVVSDALVVVFVLGAASWWRGGAAL
jgi:GET complex subunit GET2